MPRETCVVRERRETDLPALAATLVRVHAQDGYPVEGVADPLGWLTHAHALQSWTALVDDVPIGQVTLIEAAPEDDAAVAWINHTGGSVADLAVIVRLFVDPDHRTVGAGRALVDAALDHARGIGRSVALDVMVKDRAAIRLYERLGARQLGEVTHHHGDDLTEPAVVFDFPVRSPLERVATGSNAAPDDHPINVTAVERAGLKAIVDDDRAAIDRVRTVLRGALGSIPVAGSALSAAFELAWGSQFEKRTRALLEMILQDLLNIGDRVTNIERAVDRIQDPLVVSAGLTAAYAAGRCYDNEKVAHLATGVARLLRGDMPWSADADLTLALLNLLDDLTTGQLRILEFMARPSEWARRRNRTLDYHRTDEGRYLLHPMLMDAFPEVRDREASLIAIVGGLEARGLVNVTGFNDPQASFPDEEHFERGITSRLGDELMRFLRLPTSAVE